MRRNLETLIHAALLVVATCVLFIPELRTATARHVLFALVFAQAVITIHQLHASGMLGLTPKGILHARSRPTFSLLSLAALFMGIPAMIVLSLS